MGKQPWGNMKPHLYTCAALVLLAACSDPVAVTEEATVGSVVFSAAPAVVSESGDVVSTTAFVQNTTSDTIDFTFGGCGFRLWLYGDLADAKSRARLLPNTVCDGHGQIRTLQPNQTRTFDVALHLSSLRSEDLRPGRWWVVVEVDADLDNRDVNFNILAGSVILQ